MGTVTIGAFGDDLKEQFLRSELKLKAHYIDKATALWVALNPLRVWRNAFGYSIRAVAMQMHVNTSSVLDWERGIAQPRTASFAKIARMMGKSESDLLIAWGIWIDRRPDKEQENEG